MFDNIGISPSLAGLLEIGSSEAFDWDASVLADWPNIVPRQTPSIDPAPISAAESPAAVFYRAC